MTREMKDSGIEWIGEIPASWCISKNKYLLSSMYSGSTPTASDPTFYSDTDGIPFVAISDMSTTEYVAVTKKHLSNEGIANKNLQIVPSGTILYSIYATVGAVSELKISATISQAILALFLKESINKQYYKYCLLSMKDYIYYSANGNTQFNLNAEKVWNFILPLPSISDQHRIAAFLDRKCAEIDSVIANTQKTIDEYKALKQSIITEAVTKGVRGERKMKDSGVEWIEEVPEEWEVIKLKRLWAAVDSGVSVNAADIPTENENQYGVLKTSSVSSFVFLPSEHKQVNIDEYERVSCPVSRDTIIVSRMNTPELVGACGYVDRDYPNIFLPDRLWQIRFKGTAKAKFIWYYLNNASVRSYISSLSTGTSSSMQNITQTQLGNIVVALPQISEQVEICSFLDDKYSEIDRLIAAKQQLLAELESYKKSVIYEYVTGKKEVI